MKKQYLFHGVKKSYQYDEIFQKKSDKLYQSQNFWISLHYLVSLASIDYLVMNNRPFCADPLWDLNLTWYTDEPDFTKCFQNTVLIYTPLVIFLVCLPFSYTKSPNVVSPKQIWTPISLARLTLNFLLILDCLLQWIFELVYLGTIHKP